MEKDEEDDSDEEILSYGSKKLLTFTHNEVVMNFSSSEDDLSKTSEDEQSLDFSFFNDASLVNSSLETDSSKFTRFNSVLSPSPPPPPLKHPKLDLLKSSEVLQRLKKESIVPSSPEDDFWEKKSEELCQIKVRLHGQVKKYLIKKNEPFLRIHQQIAEEEKVSVSRVVLNNKTATIDVNDTVELMHITICDIVECLIYDHEHNEDTITITIQAEKRKENKMKYKISPIEKLSDVLLLYCRSNNVDMESVSFKFDGETIDPNNTAKEIEIEDGDVIDAILK